VQSRRQPAALLLGPTGAGKTPVGELLSQTGLCGRRVRHLDFGVCLRGISSAAGDDFGLDQRERDVVADCLRTGSLLEHEHFPIAEKILDSYLLNSGLAHDELLLLNGLPRHVGQAVRVDGIVVVRLVLYLACRADQVHKRILLNTGGDRSGRIDDTVESTLRRLELFERRTLPLLDHYRERGVPVVQIDVGPRTLPTEVVATIRRRLTADGWRWFSA
jgi:adenylate kinase